jgi:ribonuclease HI
MPCTLYTDGSAIPNPGKSGCGAVLVAEDDVTVLWTLSEYLGEGTNNTGEMTAILRGCQRADELGMTKVTIYTDSELSVQLVSGTKRTTKPHLKTILDRILALHHTVNYEIRWVKGHNKHKWNEYADALANKAVKQQQDVPVLAKSAVDIKLLLKCSYDEKDEVKKLGARWDAERKTWWAPNTIQNRSLFARWIQT